MTHRGHVSFRVSLICGKSWDVFFMYSIAAVLLWALLPQRLPSAPRYRSILVKGGSIIPWEEKPGHWRYDVYTSVSASVSLIRHDDACHAVFHTVATYVCKAVYAIILFVWRMSHLEAANSRPPSYFSFLMFPSYVPFFPSTSISFVLNFRAQKDSWELGK